MEGVSGSQRPARGRAVIVLPPSLDDLSFEGVFEQLAAQSADAKVTVDARRCMFASPYGLTALLAVAQSRIVRPAFLSPESHDTVTYWGRAGFYRYAEELYDIRGSVPRPQSPSVSDSLLGVTRVATTADVHSAVADLQASVGRMLIDKLHLSPDATTSVVNAIADVSDDVVMRAGASGRAGWLMAQVYRYGTPLGTRHVVVIAACDAGITLRLSTQILRHRLPRSEWDDRSAVEQAVINGVSRVGGPDVPHGLTAARDFANQWNAKLSVRTGTARVAIVPTWDDETPRRHNLADFPGVQLQVTIPEQPTTGSNRS